MSVWVHPLYPLGAVGNGEAVGTQGQGIYGGSLYLLLGFSVNLHLL